MRGLLLNFGTKFTTILEKRIIFRIFAFEREAKRSTAGKPAMPAGRSGRRSVRFCPAAAGRRPPAPQLRASRNRLTETLEMNFITAFFDSLVAFVRRNPLTVLLIVLLGLTAPALLRGLATLILYAILGFLLLVVVLALSLRWRIRKVQRQMQEQFGPDYHEHTGASYRWTNRKRHDEGEVRIHKTSATPEKRVSAEVGDYVEFEETKE